MKLTKLQESFLIKFFCVEAIVKTLISDDKPLFKSLAEVFCITKKADVEALYGIVHADEVYSVDSYETYARSMRIMDFERQKKMTVSLLPEILQALDCKGAALGFMSAKLPSAVNSHSEAYIVDSLSKKIDGQDVAVMGIAAFLMCEGVLVNRDKERALKLALKCAKWNDEFGILLLLRHDAKNREKRLSMLKTVVRNCVCNDTYGDVFAEYTSNQGEDLPESKEAALIAAYLCRNSDVQEIFNPQVARVVYSPLLSLADKQSIVLSGIPSAISEANELPLGNDVCKCPMPVGKVADYSSVKQTEAEKEIDVCLAEQSRGKRAKGLLIRCPDSYAKEEYIETFKRIYGNISVFTINAAQLRNIDLQPTRDHFVIANLIKAKVSEGVFVIHNIDESEEALIAELSLLMQYETKSAFTLQEPRVTLNLENCVFIMLSECAEVNSELGSICHTVKTEKLNAKETEAIVAKYIESAKTTYECTPLVFGKDAVSLLAQLDCKECKAVIEKFCCSYLYSDKEKTCITVEDIKSKLQQDVGGLGFIIKGER